MWDDRGHPAQRDRVVTAQAATIGGRGIGTDEGKVAASEMYESERYQGEQGDRVFSSGRSAPSPGSARGEPGRAAGEGWGGGSSATCEAIAMEDAAPRRCPTPSPQGRGSGLYFGASGECDCPGVPGGSPGLKPRLPPPCRSTPRGGDIAGAPLRKHAADGAFSGRYPRRRRKCPLIATSYVSLTPAMPYTPSEGKSHDPRLSRNRIVRLRRTPVADPLCATARPRKNGFSLDKPRTIRENGPSRRGGRFAT